MKFIRIISIFFILIIFGFVAYFALSPNPPFWTGFGESTVKSNIEPAKTLWDWLDLLIIPLAILLLGWSYKEFEKARLQKNEDERSRNEALESFINVMTELIIDYNLTSPSNHKAKAIAKTRINMTLSMIDGSRKSQVLQFLYQSDLIDKNPILPLIGADFNNSILDNIVLLNAEIKGAYFENASIQNANINNINLNSSNLTNINLSGSTVENADFSYTNLANAKMNNMDLRTVNFEGSNLTNANLKKSRITKEQLDLIIHKDSIKTTKGLVS